MARRLRSAFDRQRLWIAGISILILAALLGATVRLILVEAVVPSQIWLNELRPLDTKSTTGAALSASFVRGIEGAIADPSFVHNSYAECIQDLNAAETAGADEAYRAALQRCLAAIDQALHAAPARSDLWLERARLLLLLDGTQEELLGALRNSYRTGPREGWIAIKRLPIALRLWDSLPDDLRTGTREDVRQAMTKSVLIDAVAAMYLKDFSVRTQLVNLLEGSSDLAQQRFLEAVKKLRETSGGIAVKPVPANVDDATKQMPVPLAKLAKIEITAGGEGFEGYPIYRLLADGTPVGSATAGAVTFAAPPPTQDIQIEQISKSLTTSSFEVANIDHVDRLEIEFLNDAWGGEGEPGDRNLWIGQISVNGTIYPAVNFHMKTGEPLSIHGGMAVLYRNGSIFLTRPSAGWGQ